MREVVVWRTALEMFLEGGEDSLWLYLNRLCRDYGMDDSMAWKIADGVMREVV